MKWLLRVWQQLRIWWQTRMNKHIVLAAQIDWSGGLLQVTDTTLRIDAALFEDGQFQPRLLGDVRWAESARHPYQQQAGELVVGDLALANADGGLDALATGDVVGAEVELRRGSDADRWADLEFVFVARVSGVRLNGRSEIVLELENVLADLAGPVFSDKFASTVPNPQLEGKDIPLVLGRVKQAPVLEIDPNQLTYYTAENTSKIGQVAEGGNPTQRWTLEDQPTFNLLGSPSLPITADFEGPGDALVDLVAGVGSFASWTDGEPDGWSVATDNTNATEYVAATGGGIEISVVENVTAVSATGNSNLTSSNEDGAPGAIPWTVTQVDIGVYEADIELNTYDNAEALRVDVKFHERMEYALVGSITVKRVGSTSDDLPIKSMTAVYENGVRVPVQSTTLTDVTDGIRYRVSVDPRLAHEAWDGVTDVEAKADYVLVEFGRASGDFKVSGLVQSSQELKGGVRLTPDGVAFSKGDRLRVIIDYEAGALPMWVAMGSAIGSLDVAPNLAAPNNLVVLDPAGGRIEASVTVTDLNNFAIAFYGQNLSGAVPTRIITQIQIIRQQDAGTSYAALVPYILTTAGIDPALHLDQASINAHATAAGDPDLGWLIRGDETVDQILFRLAGSLGGCVWHGLDGKVRSKKMELPSDPGGSYLTIDASRADIEDINAYDDPAPGLTTRVHALRNWQPIPPDRQAGITSTWTESDRAAAAADWRITRVYAADSDYKRRWPAVASRDPYPSALLTGTDAQTLANQAGLWANRPRFYEVPCEIGIGELALIAVGSVVRVDLDYPGLDGRWLLVLGRAGDARPGTVNLTLWG